MKRCKHVGAPNNGKVKLDVLRDLFDDVKRVIKIDCAAAMQCYNPLQLQKLPSVRKLEYLQFKLYKPENQNM